jgi:hypothetical protein
MVIKLNPTTYHFKYRGINMLFFSWMRDAAFALYEEELIRQASGGRW